MKLIHSRWSEGKRVGKYNVQVGKADEVVGAVCQYRHVGPYCFIYTKQYPETSVPYIFISLCYVVIARVSSDYRHPGQEGTAHKYPTHASCAYQMSSVASLLWPYVCMNVRCVRNTFSGPELSVWIVKSCSFRQEEFIRHVCKEKLQKKGPFCPSYLSLDIPINAQQSIDNCKCVLH